MKKITLGFHIYEMWQILKRFAGSFHQEKPLISEEWHTKYAGQLWLKSQPQIDTSSETVFSRLMSDLGGQIVVDKFRMTPRGYMSMLCLALFPRLLHPPLSRSPLKNVSRLAQSRRLVCFYYTIDACPTYFVLNGSKKCKIRYIVGVKVWNMKMDFNIGGTWRWVEQWPLMMKIYDFFYSAKLFSCLV